MSRHALSTARDECPSDGLSDYELAERMGITRTRVFQIRQRAMEKLRVAIEEEAAAAGVTVAAWLEASCPSLHL